MRKIEFLLQFNKLALFFDSSLTVHYDILYRSKGGLRKLLQNPNKNIQKGGPQLETVT